MCEARTRLDFLLDFVDRIMVMTVDPGYAGQRIIPGAFERVKILKENVDYRERRIDIEVDGNIDVHNAALLANMGARIFVMGSSSIFKKNGSLGEAFTKFKADVDAERKVLCDWNTVETPRYDQADRSDSSNRSNPTDLSAPSDSTLVAPRENPS